MCLSLFCLEVAIYLVHPKRFLNYAYAEFTA
jgi:hypothetical protein